MFKKSYLISMLLIAMLILAACGTSDPEKESPSNDSDEQGTTEDVENNDPENDTEDDSEENSGEETDEDTEGEDQKDLNTGQTNNDNDENNNDEEQLQTNTERTESEEQNFAIQILPAYTLTSEEPGKDSLYLTEDGNTFMRIETTPFDQDAYDYFNENTISLLESTKADGEEVTDTNTLPQGVNDAIGYTVKTNENTLTGFVFEKDGLLVRLTIFDTTEQEYFNDFLKMGETITNK